MVIYLWVSGLLNLPHIPGQRELTWRFDFVNIERLLLFWRWIMLIERTFIYNGYFVGFKRVMEIYFFFFLEMIIETINRVWIYLAIVGKSWTVDIYIYIYTCLETTIKTDVQLFAVGEGTENTDVAINLAASAFYTVSCIFNELTRCKVKRFYTQRIGWGPYFLCELLLLARCQVLLLIEWVPHFWVYGKVDILACLFDYSSIISSCNTIYTLYVWYFPWYTV